MKILVNHLTRMQPGYVCVAGVDVETLNHVRPMLRHGRLTTDLLRRNGGPMEIGSVVELGPTAHAGCTPELEDYYFDPARALWLTDDAPEEYWEFLNEMAYESLAVIFGPDLTQRERSCTLDVGEGWASLGCLVPERRPSLYVDHRGSVRMLLNCLTPPANLPVTDLRLYERDHRTPRLDLIADIRRRIDAGVEVILSVGLTRPWRKQGDVAERHWLQVNNIHLKDDPLWRQGL
ncbi:MAG: hypothetical protein M3N18_05200 [Actinomycetota bacterium]|nr:hypothetical protein [Actinomycetota bacterium]